jgi:hypothetical protein
MKRMEPPQLAVWMLEHLTPVERDEALAGDLLEVFRAGRSTNWYWRQVLAACAVSWYESLRARGSLLTFALLWSMMSPTWNSLCIRLENGNPIPDRLWFISGPLWLIPALLLWTILHSLFLWTGILSFGVLNLIAKNPVSPTKIKRGFLLASAIFVPLYGATFLLVTLNWYSHFENWQLGNSALGELTDLRPLADAIRIPYFVALIVALWGVVPRLVRSPQLAKTELFEASDSSEPSAQIEPIDLPRAKRFLAFVAIAGLINSMISALILGRLPELHESDLGALFGRALMLVLLCTFAGVGGSWLYWKNPSSPFRTKSPISFDLFALASSAGWMWIPAMILFQEQLSAAGALVAMVGALVLGSSLRRVTHTLFVAPQMQTSALQFTAGDLFEESLYRPPIEVHGYAIALGAYLAGAALVTRSSYTAALLLSASAFLFVWKRSVLTDDSKEKERQYRRAIFRLLRIAIPVVLVTTWALLEGVAHRNSAAASSAVSVDKNETGKVRPQTAAYSINGFESVILWPYPVKKQIVPPILLQKELLAPGTLHPLVIRFTGSYWYVQPPHSTPGPTAYKAHGTPLGVNIASINQTPLVMQAHLESASRFLFCTLQKSFSLAAWCREEVIRSLLSTGLLLVLRALRIFLT